MKGDLRRAALARREAAQAEVDQHPAVERLDDELKPFAGRPVAFYMPMRSEIDPRAAMLRAALRGPVLLPVTQPGRALTFRRWRPGALLVRDRHGVEHPDEGQETGTPLVLVVPLLSFDAVGHRLGYGGGYYDRTLEALRAAGPVTAIGFAFAAQEVARLPALPTDQRLDGVVTEREVRWFG